MFSNDKESDPIKNPDRLRIVEELRKATRTLAPQFDRLAQSAAETLKVPISVITLICTEDQSFVGEFGLPEVFSAQRKTPLSYSICQYTVRLPHPLSIKNTELHPLVMDHPAVLDTGIKAYLGFPLFDAGGLAVGTLCFVDFLPRQWEDEEMLAAIQLALEVSDSLEEALAAFQNQAKE
jgi:GAF domain-containing protein